jgi:hypothetical protein
MPQAFWIQIVGIAVLAMAVVGLCLLVFTM